MSGKHPKNLRERSDIIWIVIIIDNVTSFVIVNFVLSEFFQIVYGLCSFVFFYQIYIYLVKF